MMQQTLLDVDYNSGEFLKILVSIIIFVWRKVVLG